MKKMPLAKLAEHSGEFTRVLFDEAGSHKVVTYRIPADAEPQIVPVEIEAASFEEAKDGMLRLLEQGWQWKRG